MSEQITITKEEKKEFILKSLIHYFKDPTQCGFSEKNTCTYRTNENKKCAVGQYIAEENYKPEMEGYSIYSEIMFKDIEQLLVPKAKNKLTRGEWSRVQLIHDAIARHYNRIDTGGKMLNITDAIKSLEEYSLIDLKELKDLLIDFKQKM